MKNAPAAAQDASEIIANGNNARAIEVRRLDEEQAVHAAIRESAFEDTERPTK